jgi:hypothetical protein
LPWLGLARQALGDPAQFGGLQRLLDTMEWRAIEAATGSARFNLAALLGYLCRHDLIERVLARDAARAAQRHAALIDRLSALHAPDLH